MSDNELQAKLSVQLGQALAGFKALSGELRDVKRNVAELSKGTNQLQQETAKTTKTQVEGAQAAGKATKSYTDYVNEQAKKLQEAKIKAAALADAQRMLGMNAPKRIIAPTVEEFRALDQAKASVLGFGRAQHEMTTRGMSGLDGLNSRFMGLAAGAMIAIKVAGDLAQRWRELDELGVKNYRTTGAAAVGIDQSLQSTNIVDVAGITEEALHLKGVASQAQLQEFVQQSVQHNPDMNDDRMRGLLHWFANTTTPKGGSETMARMAGLAPGASIPQLDRMTGEYMKGSGGRSMGQSEAKGVRDLVNTGFFTAPQALSLVSSLSAYERSGEVSSIVEKLKPPKATGKIVEDSAAADKWWQKVGYMKGQPGGPGSALQQVAPELAAELSGGALGRRFNTTEYRLTTGVPSSAYAPQGDRAQAEYDERFRDRSVEISTVMDWKGMAKARRTAGRQASLELRKNMAAGGDGAAMAGEMLDAAQQSLPFKLEEVTRPMINTVTAPSVPTSTPQRPIQVEIVRDSTIRPQTY